MKAFAVNRLYLTIHYDPLFPFSRSYTLHMHHPLATRVCLGNNLVLERYVPIDFLQVPQRATTRDEAILALRHCDRLCMLILNQSHCVKNDNYVVLALVEHVMTQVVPLPKPRGADGLVKRAGRADRRHRREAEKKKKKDDAVAARRKAASKGAKARARKKKADRAAAAAAGGESKGDGESKADSASAAADSTAAATAAGATAELEADGEDNGEDNGEDGGDDSDQDPDFEVGKKGEADMYAEDCIWDQPITYSEQVELMLTLRRLVEVFVGSFVNIQLSRPLDAVAIVVPGCIAAVGDAVMRRRASDHPR